MAFWLDRGIDGFRVDAVPYLFEREGTNCENLPETHDFLKEMRQFVESRYPGSLLLAEANQWPSDLLPYFGQGDEFHMAFNFPLMPRLFMAIRREDQRPIDRHHEPDARYPRRTASGPFFCATTTSSLWKWSPMKSAIICTQNMRVIRECGSTWGFAAGSPP